MLLFDSEVKQRLLIVDDVPHNIKLLNSGLENEYTVSVALNGKEALEIIHKNQHPDLILLDILMPEMDGYEVCRRLKSSPDTEHIPVIFLTAKDAVEDETFGLEIGAVDYITKPFSMGIVRSRIRAHLETRLQQEQLELLVRQRTEQLERVNEQLRKDIAERKRIEKDLRHSKKRYRHLFENAPISIFEADMNEIIHKFYKINQRAVKTFGISYDALPVELSQIIPGISVSLLKQMTESLKQGNVFSAETFALNLHKPGEQIPVRLIASAIAPPDIDQVVIAIEDITAEKNRRNEKEAIAEERRRIARDIHDGIAQDLVSFKLKTKYWHKIVDENPQQMHQELDIFRELLNNNIRDVRRSIFALRPLDIETFGFFPGVDKFVSDFSEYNQIKIDLRVLGDQDSLPDSFETVLFRIIQESLNNASKHANAQLITIILDIKDDAVILTIQDNGKGLDQNDLINARKTGHLGMIQMRERVESIGGSFVIQSIENGIKGTIVQVTLPK